jgi:hypothetical protein
MENFGGVEALAGWRSAPPSLSGSDAQGSGLNLTGLEDLSGLMTVTTTLCITT